MLAPRRDGIVEMLLTYAHAFALATAAIEFERGRINGLLLQQQYDVIDANHPAAEPVLLSLTGLRRLCESIPSLNPVLEPIGVTEEKIAQGILPIVLYNELELLQRRMFQELKGHYYYPVVESYAATYMNVAPFGEAVYNNFPSARLDIQDAGKCIILGQGTAGVFHLMRVMEVALKVLGRDLRIPYAPSWEAYIRQITAKIEASHGAKPPAWKKKEKFYKDILGDLIAIKHAWRNPTMHIVNEYSPEMATRVYQAVLEMMQRMAEQGLREKGRPVAVTVALAAPA